MKKSLGIIGSGAVTQNQYARVLGMFHDVSVDYIYDINTESAKRVSELFGAKSISIDELLANSDIIVIATPPSTHFELVKKALKKGRRIVCEKPFVGTLEECEELIRLAKDAECELYVAHFRRCLPAVKLAREIVKTGILGQLVEIQAYEGGRFSWQTQSGYVYKDPFGGVLFDTGSHTIDTAFYAANLDDCQMDASVVDIQKDKKEPAHHVEAKLHLTANGIKVDFTVKLSRKILLSNKIRIRGTNGWIDIPVGLSNYIRLSTDSGSVVLYTNYSYDDLMDCFAMQFKEMFYECENSSFVATRFINLTKVLETIANN